MSDSENTFTYLSESEIEQISSKLNKMMITIKPDVKPEMHENPTINDMPQSSHSALVNTHDKDPIQKIHLSLH